MRKLHLLFLLIFLFIFVADAQLRPVQIMAANTTSGRYQRYEGPGIRIFQAFKPDICCVQEFNYDGSISDFVTQAFGSDYKYYREPYTGGGDIPNGIVYHKDYQLLDSGSWDSSQIDNRGFAYVRLDVPGENNPHMLVISVHLSTTSSKRSQEAKEVVAKILEYYNVNHPSEIKDYIVLGGDFNVGSRNASVMWTLKENGLFLDQPIPVDQNFNSATNSSRSKEHDFVLTNALLHQHNASFNIGSNSFPNGLVFDSRVYSPLSEVAPVEKNDSGASNMQHMAIIKMYYIPCD